MSDIWSEIVSKLDRDIERTEIRLAELHAARASIEPLVGRPPVRRGRLPSLEKVVARAAKARGKGGKGRPGGTGKSRAKLPATGAQFWLEILGTERHTGREIVDAAMERLALGEAVRDKIYSRASNWFNGAIKRGLVVVAEQRDGVNVYQKV